MKDDEIIIHIKEDRTVKLKIIEKGSVKTKYIKPETLFEAIKNSIKADPLFTGILPSNIISLRQSDDGSRYAVLEYAYDSADINYNGTEYKSFPLPRLIFGFMLEKSGRISRVNLGVPELGKLTPDTKMFFYPFSNVSRFSLCTGGNALPKIKNLQNLKNMPNYMLSLPDNDDYYNSSHNRKNLERRDLMEHLADKDRRYYYENILIPMPDTKLKDFL